MNLTMFFFVRPLRRDRRSKSTTTANKMKVCTLTLFNVYFATAALRGQQRRLRPKALKTDIGDISPPPPPEYETVFIRADDAKDPRRVPDNAPPNANKDAYAALLNKQDVQHVEFRPSFDDNNLFVPAEESDSIYRAKGALLLEVEGIDSVTITPEEMEDCDPEMSKMAYSSSTCRTVFDTTMEGRGVAFETYDDEYDEFDVPEDERYDEEDYLKELQDLVGDDEPVFLEDVDLEDVDDRMGHRRLNINTRNIGIFEPLQVSSQPLLLCFEKLFRRKEF